MWEYCCKACICLNSCWLPERFPRQRATVFPKVSCKKGLMTFSTSLNWRHAFTIFRKFFMQETTRTIQYETVDGRDGKMASDAPTFLCTFSSIRELIREVRDQDGVPAKGPVYCWGYGCWRNLQDVESLLELSGINPLLLRFGRPEGEISSSHVPKSACKAFLSMMLLICMSNACHLSRHNSGGFPDVRVSNCCLYVWQGCSVLHCLNIE